MNDATLVGKYVDAKPTGSWSDPPMSSWKSWKGIAAIVCDIIGWGLLFLGVVAVLLLVFWYFVQDWLILPEPWNQLMRAFLVIASTLI